MKQEFKNSSIMLVIDAENLRKVFSNMVIEIISMCREMKPKEDKLLTRQEAMELLRVDSSTLWHWNKNGYLKHVKVGARVYYRESDIKKLQGQPDDQSGHEPQQLGDIMTELEDMPLFDEESGEPNYLAIFKKRKKGEEEEDKS